MMIYKSEITIPDVEKKTHLLKTNTKPLVIFGTGNYGAMAFHALKNKGISVNFFCDNNKAHWGTRFCGCPVISPCQLQDSYPDSLVLIASLRFKFMAHQLRNNHAMTILDCDFLFSELDLSGIESAGSPERLIWMLDLYQFAIDAARDVKELKVKSLDVVVTEKCSLKCRNCSNLMQYYQKPRDVDSGLLLASLDRFMETVDELFEARVLGGEPFMYKDLAAVIRKLCSYPRCKKVTIMSNGTLLPRKEVLETLLDPKVSLIISDYGSLSKNINGLKELLSRHHIPFISESIDSWQDCATIQYRQRNEIELIDLFGDCCVNDTLTLLHGKLYGCPFSAHVDNLKAVPFDSSDDNLDLMKTENTRIKRMIRNLTMEKKYLKACSFCAGRDYNVDRIEVAVQAESPVPYKMYDLHENHVPDGPFPC